jgi:hypothetical protein
MAAEQRGKRGCCSRRNRMPADERVIGVCVAAGCRTGKLLLYCIKNLPTTLSAMHANAVERPAPGS